MPFVGLTGGMGAGKSTALAALERLGAAVLSSDAVVHELYAGEQLRDAAVGRWGAEVAPNGVIDRAAVAARAFASAEDRGLAGGPGVAARRLRVAAWLEQVRSEGPAAPRGGGRGPAAVRGGPGGALRRDACRHRRRGAPQRRAADADMRSRRSAARQLSSRRRRAERRSWCAMTGPSRISSGVVGSA